MEDAEIIDLYWQRDQRAIDETHGKYGGFLAGIAWNILSSHSDAEECVNDRRLFFAHLVPMRDRMGVFPFSGGLKFL